MTTSNLDKYLYNIRRIEEHREEKAVQELKRIYKRTIKDLRSQLGNYFANYADADGHLTYTNLHRFSLDARLLEEVAANMGDVAAAEKRIINQLVEDTYKNCYTGMIHAVEHAVDEDDLQKVFADVSAAKAEQIQAAVNNPIHGLTLSDQLEKNRVDIVYTIRQTIGVGLSVGDNYTTMAKRIEKVLIGDKKSAGGAYAKSLRIARTEAHRVREQGNLDAAKSLTTKLSPAGYTMMKTWHTMKDERVRPKHRYMTKSGWKYSKKGKYNHEKMEGVSVAIDEKFKLPSGAEADAPGQSGVAGEDINCRCFLSYEIRKEAVQAPESNDTIETSQNDVAGKLSSENFPSALKSKSEIKNTQKLVDYVNENCKDADSNVIALYNSMGKMENIESNGISFNVSHGENHAVSTSYYTLTGEFAEAKLTIPKLKGENLAGQVNTTLHEEMHLMDLYGRADVDKSGNWFSTGRSSLVNIFKKTSAEMSDDVKKLFAEHDKAWQETSSSVFNKYNKQITALDEAVMDKTFKGTFSDYKKQYKKLQSSLKQERDYECRNIMGGGIGNLQDIYDALSGGTFRDTGVVKYGHGSSYYRSTESRVHETIANYASLSITRPDLIKLLRADKPELVSELDATIVELLKKVGDK